MSYELIASSRDSARPVELYHFHYSGNNWFFNTSDHPITHLGLDFLPVPVKSSPKKPTTDPTKANITITLRGTNPVGELFRIAPPSEAVFITVYEGNAFDSDFVVTWKGRILGADWTDGSLLELTSESVFSSAQRQGVRDRIQTGCPFVLYGPLCGVPREDFKDEAVVTGVSGLAVTVNIVSERVANYYAGGMMTWQHAVNGNIEKRMIRSSTTVTGQLILGSRPVGLVANTAVTLFAGCSHTLEGVNGCGPKFNNTKRYGGCPYLPEKGPFGGTAIY